MNIFFNSRINANQSLLNVLFGQQQKAASSQNTGCRGTRDTLTISASGKEKLTKSTSGRTHNTSIDSSIDLKSYIASAKKMAKAFFIFFPSFAFFNVQWILLQLENTNICIFLFKSLCKLMNILQRMDAHHLFFTLL